VAGAVALAESKWQRLMCKKLLWALVTVSPQRFRELLPPSTVGQGSAAITPTTTKLALNPSSQPSEVVGGMLSGPLQ